MYFYRCRWNTDEALKSLCIVLFRLDDQVYMEDDKEKREYVLNEQGRLYQGSARYISGAPWNFGQV